MDFWTDETRAFAKKAISRKARQLLGKRRLNRSDREDLEQELWLQLLKRVHRFDPSIAHAFAFITTLVDRLAVSILRRLSRKKRDRRNVLSLNVMVPDAEDGGMIELSRLIRQDHLDDRRGRWTATGQELSELAFDLAILIERLPPDLRDICERLKKKSGAAVARDLDVPRCTVQSAIRRIRWHLRDYFRQKS